MEARAYVVDLFSLPERHDVAKAIVEDAVNYFDDEGVNMINYQVVKSHLFERIFKRHGFLDTKMNRYFFFEKMIEEPVNLETIPANKIHFAYGDLTGIM